MEAFKRLPVNFPLFLLQSVTDCCSSSILANFFPPVYNIRHGFLIMHLWRGNELITPAADWAEPSRVPSAWQRRNPSDSVWPLGADVSIVAWCCTRPRPPFFPFGSALIRPQFAFVERWSSTDFLARIKILINWRVSLLCCSWKGGRGGLGGGIWDHGMMASRRPRLLSAAALFSAAHSVCADWTSSHNMEVVVWKSSGVIKGFGPVTKISCLCLYCGRLT